MSLWINGDWQSGRGPARSKHNPVSQTLLWQGNDADADQVALAVSAARAAFPAWRVSRLPPGKRSRKSLLLYWKRTKAN